MYYTNTETPRITYRECHDRSVHKCPPSRYQYIKYIKEKLVNEWYKKEKKEKREKKHRTVTNKSYRRIIMAITIHYPHPFSKTGCKSRAPSRSGYPLLSNPPSPHFCRIHSHPSHSYIDAQKPHPPFCSCSFYRRIPC